MKRTYAYLMLFTAIAMNDTKGTQDKESGASHASQSASQSTSKLQEAPSPSPSQSINIPRKPVPKVRHNHDSGVHSPSLSPKSLAKSAATPKPKEGPTNL